MSHRLLLMIVQPSDSARSIILTKEQEKQQEKAMGAQFLVMIVWSHSPVALPHPLGLTRSTDWRSYNPCLAPSTLTTPKAAEVKIVSIRHQ